MHESLVLFFGFFRGKFVIQKKVTRVFLGTPSLASYLMKNIHIEKNTFLIPVYAVQASHMVGNQAGYRMNSFVIILVLRR